MNPVARVPTSVRGYTRVAVRVAWWNIFHMAVLVIWAGLLVSEQGAELLRMQGGLPPMLVGAVLYFAVLVGLSSYMTARGGEGQLGRLVGYYDISLSVSRRVAQVYAPLFMAPAPLVALGIATDKRVWFVAAVITGYFMYEFAMSHFRSRYEGPVRPTVPERFSSWWIWIVLLVWALLVAGSSTAISKLPDLSRTVGTLGVAIVALGAWSTLLTLALIAAPLRAGLPSLALTAPLIWIGAGFMMDANLFPRRDLDFAKVTERAAAVSSPIELDLAFLQWLAKFESTPANENIPVFLVSAEGGGIRAAYWTARVMAELDERSNGEFSRHAFALSGVSGGSVGVSAFGGAMLTGPKSAVERTRRLEAFFGRDYLSPLVAHLLITEPIWQLTGHGVPPRDVEFERQFARDWSETFGNDLFSRPFLDAFSISASADVPAFMINSTNVEQGKRVVFSNVILKPGEAAYVPMSGVSELRETLKDLTVAEVAHLSARFLFVSPPASVVGFVNDGSPQPVRQARVWGRLVDGGYFDNSGGLAIEEAVRDLSRWRQDEMRRTRQDVTRSRQGPPLPLPADAPVADRGRALLPRVIFHALVLRNDPLAATDDTPDIPTLRETLESPDKLRRLPVAMDLERSAYAPYMPKRIPMSELTSPLDAILAAREARGLQSRASLRKAIATYADRQQARCDTAPPPKPGESPPPCPKDQYWEVSLSEELSDAGRRQPVFAAEGCKDVGLRKDVALGWVLSPNSQSLLTCLAKGSSRVDRVLESSRLRVEVPR
jgi:hypothetical protein